MSNNKLSSYDDCSARYACGLQLLTYRQRGQLTLAVLIFGFLATIILTGLIMWVDVSLKSAYRNIHRDSAFRIAEAGVEYYRWHLAHAQTDFQDGTGQPGPYIHDFYDKSGNLIGKYELEIIPPIVGSTVVTVRSTGTVEGVSGLEKVIEVKFAKPSFAKYTAVLNDSVRFGEGTEVFGPIHSNGGIHFDGVAHNIVTSAVAEYNDPDHSGGDEFGVHTHIAPVDPAPPAAVHVRSDVFMAGRQFPVPAVDFVGISNDLASIKSAAQASGRYFGPLAQNDDGYHMVFRTNDTFDLYRVTDVVNPPNGCIQVIGQKDWGTWSINTQQFIGNYTIPTDGRIFFEEHVWIDGQIDTARVVVGAGIFPENSSNYAHIIINNDLLYTNYDGQDVMGLIAQGDITVGMVSEDDLRIDAAVFAQNDRVGRFYYRPPLGSQNRCSPYHVRQVITIYGMIGSNDRYGFAYTDGTGYQIRNLIYDPNLLYGPPPSFPLTSDYYEQIFWNEVK